MKNPLLLLSFCFLSIFAVDAQVQFNKSTDDLEKGSFTMGFTDVNGDYRDDVIIQGDNRRVHLYLQTENKGMHFANTAQLSGDADWSLTVLDMNNDGKKEIISSGAYNGTYLIDFNNTVDFSYELDLIEPGIIFAQNANSADIDNDGFLDYFVCHDDGDSHMYMNDGQGSFSKDNSMFDFVTTPTSDGSGNYGSIWADIDGDNDLDLYIAKCRGFAGSDLDPRRINQLHINNGDGTFTEQANAFGLASGEQTWAADFADADNDGDLDCFMVQHTGPNMLFENIDNQFVPKPDYIEQAISGTGFQGFFHDFDNDGLVDIIIAGDADYILWNKGNLTFETEETPLSGTLEMASLALGDSNGDGFTDILTSYNTGFGVGNQKSEIWLNKGNDNNHVSVSLRGVQSNREGVGAKIWIHSALGIQIRNLTSGEGYGVVNSLTQRYGLANNTNIDSMEILWPSGHRDVFMDLDVNKHYLVTEGDCVTSLESNYYEDYIDVFCEGQSTSITSTTALDWNTGENTNEIQITSSGFYNANLPQDADCHSAFATIVIDVETEEKGLVSYSNQYACKGESVLLNANVQNPIWSNGMETTQISVDESGSYSFTATGNCSEIISDTIEIQILDPQVLDDQYIASTQGDNLVIDVEGENINWFTIDDLQTSFHQGNQFTIDNIQESVEYLVIDILESPKNELNVGLPIPPANDYSSNNTNAGLYFNVLEDMYMEGMQINTDLEGSRLIEITQNGNLMHSKEIEITEVGEQFITLGFEIEKGSDYYISTNEFSNEVNLGMNSPRFTRSSNVNGFPFVGDGLMELTDSYFGPEYYYYFYHWKVSTLSTVCESNQAKIEIDVETVAVNDLDLLNDLNVFPLPASNELNIHSENYNITSLEMYDMHGKAVLYKEISENTVQLDISSLSEGMYILKIKSDSGKNAFLKVPRIK